MSLAVQDPAQDPVRDLVRDLVQDLVQDLAPAAAASSPLVFPLSSSQERCWFINALDPGTTALNVALRWELRGRIDRAAFARAFAAVVERHEVLRTRVVERDGELLQEVLPPFEPALVEVDLSGLPEADQAGEMGRLGHEEAHRPFDPATLPLLRTTLLRTAPDRAILLVTVHQIAFDGWSIRLISREFGTAAAAILAGRPVALPELPLQYGDYARWQQAYFASGQFEREIAFWKGQLGDAPYFEVPGDRPRPLRPTSRGVITATLLDDEVAAAMAALVKSKGVTLFAFGCAVMAAALHRRTGAFDIVFGTQVAGRDDPDLDGLIGVFINNLVLRFDLAGPPSFDALLARANRTVQEALVHQSMPFHRLVEILKPPRDPRRMPLISVNFTVLQDVMADARYGDVELLGRPSLSAGSLYDLNFFMVHWPTGWRMALEYNTDLFDRNTGEGLLALWRDTLGQALAGRLRIAADAVPGPATHPRSAVAGDVEAILRGHPAVAEAALVEVEGLNGVGHRHAFVTLRPDYGGLVDRLPSVLGAEVAAAQPDLAPATTSVLMRLPRRPDGAIDHAALAAMVPPPGEAIAPSPVPSAARRTDDDLGDTVRRIWTEVLGVASVSADTSFFAAGGHSLLALRMVRKVADATGLRPAVVTLFAAPTLAGFVNNLRAMRDGHAPAGEGKAAPPAREAVPGPDPQGGPEDWTCIAIRPPGTSTAIFGINSIEELYGFAKDLGGDRGLYSVQLFQAGGEDPFAGKDFETIARDYVAVIRAVQPEGPYILFGLCVHGVLALAVAHQLRAAGQRVELLALKHTWHPTYIDRLSRLNRGIVRVSQVRDNFRFVLRGEKGFASFLANYRMVRRTGLLHLAVRLGLLPAVPNKTGSAHNDAFLLSLMRARDRYRPAAYDGAVIQYLGRDTPKGRGFDPTLGWTGTLTGPLALRDDAEEQAPPPASPAGEARPAISPR